MIDFETLGLRPDCVVLSVGLCALPYQEPGSTVTFYEEADWTKQPHRVIDEATLAWWNTQPIGLMPNSSQLLSQVVDRLDRQLNNLASDYELFIWANGTDFDIPILYNLYDTHGLKPVWKYSNVRDFRTLRKLFPEIEEPERTGTLHNAIADAWHQAKWCSKILGILGKKPL